MHVDMHIVRSKFTSAAGKTYQTVLLRESYREGNKVKKRTIANLTRCSPEEIAAIELALQYKHNLTDLGSINDIQTKEGLSIGSAWTIYSIANQLGIVNALGSEREGQLALWQIIARVLEQGSRLSAVRLGETYALASTIGLENGFCEDDLYKNLCWLTRHQEQIETQLFQTRFHATPPQLFLYDVTSSYLEGDKNELADWGYNRDKKNGKKQIVIGLMCTEDGVPVTTEVFKGNTQDPATLSDQINKIKDRFGCTNITFVGDRGMIKSGQIEALAEEGYHYITALTKKQIETLIHKKIVDYSLFDKNICEASCDGIRYIFRKNPLRAQEIAQNRFSKKSSIEKLIADRNNYLAAHPKAMENTALAMVNKKIQKLGMSGLLSVQAENKKLNLMVDETAWEEAAKFDGCYVLKTDLPSSVADKQTIHDRYKDLAFVESAFKTVKSDLDIRPIYVRTEESTRGHVFIVMLAYMIMKKLDQMWSSLYFTVEEGLRSLSTLCINEVSANGKMFQQIPQPRLQNQKLLQAAGVQLPKVLPKNSARVVTRVSRRKSALPV